MSADSIHFKELINNLKVGVCRTSTEGVRKFVFVNLTFLEMFGYSSVEIIKLSLENIFEDKEKYRALIRKTRAQGFVKNEEIRLRGKDKRAFWCLVTCVAAKEKGSLKYLDIVLEDISVQKGVEKELMQSKELFRTVFDNSAAAITVTDKEEKIIAWNPFAEKMLEMSKADLFNKPVRDLYSQKEWRRLRSFRARRKGIVSDIETQIIKKDGSLIDVHMSISVLKDENGNVTGAIGIMRDMSEQKKIRQMLMQAKSAAEEANSTKSLFLANMSHEVRTPMSTIIGMIDLTLDTPLNDEQKDNLKVAKDAADNLLGLLNDILDLSRVEADKINLECIEINLPNVVKSVCKGLSVLAKKKDLELDFAVDPDVPEVVEGDPVRLRQILVNLINNAIKFTHKGKIVTTIKTLSKSENECELLFGVTDTGIGIPKDKHDLIFKVFTQADDTTTRRYGGTGLGLAISKRLVEMMGGRIWVESEAGKGSTFFFSTKLKCPKERTLTIPLEEEDNQKQGDRRDLKDLRILLAEDNLVNQKITVKMLEKQGWNVSTSTDGQEVLDRLVKESFDLILMDTQMPNLDGIETTRRIRENEKSTGKHIPIIALTARAMEDDRKRCLSAGMDEHVSKPIDRIKLFEVIESILKKGNSDER